MKKSKLYADDKDFDALRSGFEVVIKLKDERNGYAIYDTKGNEVALGFSDIAEATEVANCQGWKILPTPNNTTQDRELFTGGDWWCKEANGTFLRHVDNGSIMIGSGKDYICQMFHNPDDEASQEENERQTEANALLISEAKNLLKIAKRAAFLFSNENNYPEGTIGYGIWKDATEILTRITNKK